MPDYLTAQKHLAVHDSVLARLIELHGPIHIELRDNYYFALCSSIIGQQLSVKAAASIKSRFVDLFDGTFPLPEQILEIDAERLRQAGFSYKKAAYIKDLAQHILDGRLELNKLAELTNEKIICELVAVKGIGEWTAHMFLIFALGRMDVLPVGDLGLRMGVKKLYELSDTPGPAQINEIAASNNWHPYEAVATWYIWRSLDNEPNT